MRERDDGTLRRLFAELREQDLRAVPDFEPLRRSAIASGSHLKALRLWVAAAALLLGAVLLALWVGQRRSAAFGTIAALSTWRSPTESLLRTPGDQMLRFVPAISTSAVRFESPRLQTLNQ